MPTIENILEQVQLLSEPDQEQLLRELRRRRFDHVFRRIEEGPEPPMPVSDEELDRIVHEARRGVLRARGL